MNGLSKRDTRYRTMAQISLGTALVIIAGVCLALLATSIIGPIPLITSTSILLSLTTGFGLIITADALEKKYYRLTPPATNTITKEKDKQALLTNYKNKTLSQHKKPVITYQPQSVINSDLNKKTQGVQKILQLEPKKKQAI